MSMILNDIWSDFCRNIQASTDNDIDRKIAAVNAGQRYLLDRCIQLLSEDLIPKDFLSDPTNLSNDASAHRFDLPSDFKKLFAVWRKITGSRYEQLTGKSIITYDQLLEISGQNFFDTDYTGDILRVAIAEPYLYSDKYITDAGTDNIKLQYYQTPANLVAYEQLVITGVTGTFVANETISGNESSATAKVYQVDGDDAYLNIFTKDYLDGPFISGETLTGSSSGATATLSSITEKPATLKLTSKYKEHLIEAAGLQYHVGRGSDEIEGRSLTVDNWIENIKALNQNRVQIQWGLYGSVR